MDYSSTLSSLDFVKYGPAWRFPRQGEWSWKCCDWFPLFSPSLARVTKFTLLIFQGCTRLTLVGTYYAAEFVLLWNFDNFLVVFLVGTYDNIIYHKILHSPPPYF